MSPLRPCSTRSRPRKTRPRSLRVLTACTLGMHVSSRVMLWLLKAFLIRWIKLRILHDDTATPTPESPLLEPDALVARRCDYSGCRPGGLFEKDVQNELKVMRYNFDPIKRQDLGRGQHIGAIFLVLRVYTLTSDDVEHKFVLLIVVAALSQARGGRVPRGLQLRNPMLIRGDERAARPDVDDVDRGQRVFGLTHAAGTADGAARIAPDHQEKPVVDVLDGHPRPPPAFWKEVVVQCPLIIEDVLDFNRPECLPCCLIATADGIDQRLSSLFDGNTAYM
jgi:hypothetical protein